MKQFGWIWWLALPWLLGADAPGWVEFSISEPAGDDRLPCRIHLLDSADQPVKPIQLDLPYWHDHFVCEGVARVQLPPGEYRCEIERGPEYATARRTFSVGSQETVTVDVSLSRLADLASEGWWSGETHVHRPLEDIELLMRAEDLHIAVVQTWWNDRNPWREREPPNPPIISFDSHRFYDSLGGEDERGGGALLISGLSDPLPIAGSQRENPPSTQWLTAAKELGAWVDAEKPFWWDFPLWLSTGQLDSVGIANNHMCRRWVYPGEAWGRPRDTQQLPVPHGNGLWSQIIYYHALNSGFHLPPSAGSASGVLPNPVGYNRMYAHVDGDLSWEKWWTAVRAGNLFVTNGPLLRLTAEGQLPGHRFKLNGIQHLTIDGALDSRDPIATIELVQNGNIQRIEGFPATVTIENSGWFLIRVLADVADTFRFASTAPWYVEIDGEPAPIRQESCHFFQQWTEERLENLRGQQNTDDNLRDILPVHQAARDFWAARAQR